MALKIWTYKNNKNAQKAEIAAQYVGVEIEEPPFQFGVTNKTEEFLKLTPIGKENELPVSIPRRVRQPSCSKLLVVTPEQVPVLETPQGSLFESNAIARYVARLGKDKLFGANDFENGQVDQWIDFASNDLWGPLMKWTMAVCGMGEYKEEEIEKCRKEAERGLAALEKGLASSPDMRLVGGKLTLADIIVVCELVISWQCIFSQEFMKPYPSVEKYVAALLKEPEFVKVLGSVEQAPKTPTGPLSKEENPFFKPKRSSSEANGVGADANKKAKADE